MTTPPAPPKGEAPSRSSKVLLLSLLLGATLLLSACTATGHPGTAGGPGFFWGLWHGTIAPFTFIISLFNPSVGVYEVANSGGWYDFGFLLGIGAFGGGGAAAASR